MMRANSRLGLAIMEKVASIIAFESAKLGAGLGRTSSKGLLIFVCSLPDFRANSMFQPPALDRGRGRCAPRSNGCRRQNREFFRPREIIFVQRIRSEIKKFGCEFAVRGRPFQNFQISFL